jgi:hypothetical protein
MRNLENDRTQGPEIAPGGSAAPRAIKTGLGVNIERGALDPPIEQGTARLSARLGSSNL